MRRTQVSLVARLTGLLVALGMLGVGAAPAAGSVLIGSDLSADPGFCRNAPTLLVQTAAPSSGVAAGGMTAPSDGVVVRWSVKSAQAYPDGNRLRIVRPGLATMATGAGTGAAHALANGLNTFEERLPIEAGEGIGVNAPFGACFLVEPSDGTVSTWEPPLIDGAAPIGATVSFNAALSLRAEIEPDTDTDGFGDESQDNCPTVTNADQTNTDGGQSGDACDSDDDNDGVLDAADNCRVVVNAGQQDVDRDGAGDACDADDDGDGVLDTADNCDAQATLDLRDLDGDGAGDVCDADDDGDGVPDASDNCATAANADQSDLDADGSGDACDADDDNDGLFDAVELALGTSSGDLDSDDDGLSDAREDRNLDGKKGRRETSAVRFDTDRDGLSDGLERGLRRGVANPPGPIAGTGRRFRRDRHPGSKTNPLKRDTDKDGVRDGREDKNHNGRVDKGETDPNKPGGE